MLALENLLPVVLDWSGRRRWKRAAESLARRRPEIGDITGRHGDEGGGFVVGAPVEQLRQVLVEGNREKYNTFWDMYDLVLYTGYQSVMSLLQPMTPCLFLINDMLEVRRTDFTSERAPRGSHSCRVCRVSPRPVIRRVDSIAPGAH